MGSFRVADALTGRALPDDDPVVAIVIAKRRGGYPDAEKAAAHRPIGASHIFEPVSLPIRGHGDSYGGIEPLPNQIAVDLACRMVGVDSWKAFSEQAFDFGEGGGVSIQRDSFDRMFSGKEAAEKQILGLVVFSEASWQHLLEAYGQSEKRAQHLTDVRAVLEDAAAALNEQDSTRWGRAFDLLSLRSSAPYCMADGRKVELPSLCRALSSSEGGSTFSGDFSTWINGRNGVLGTHAFAKGVPKHLDELLAGVWEMQTAIRAFGYLNRILVPSPTAGQSENAEDVAEVSFMMLEQSIDEIVLEVEEGMVDDLDALNRIADRLAEMQANLQARIEALPVDEYRGPTA